MFIKGYLTCSRVSRKGQRCSLYSSVPKHEFAKQKMLMSNSLSQSRKGVTVTPLRDWLILVHVVDYANEVQVFY